MKHHQSLTLYSLPFCPDELGWFTQIGEMKLVLFHFARGWRIDAIVPTNQGNKTRHEWGKSSKDALSNLFINHKTVRLIAAAYDMPVYKLYDLESKEAIHKPKFGKNAFIVYGKGGGVAAAYDEVVLDQINDWVRSDTLSTLLSNLRGWGYESFTSIGIAEFAKILDRRQA